MATMHSESAADRVSARRQGVIDELVDHAADVVAQSGAGALTVSEVARRIGMRPPSVYKYFPSLHALYDAVFERGNRLVAARVEEEVAGLEPGLERMLATARAMTVWGIEEQGYAALMFWRPIPGWEPSAEAFAPAQELVAGAAADAAAAVEAGELAADADPAEVLRMVTVVSSGVVSQHLANEPGVAFDDGSFTTLLDRGLAMVVASYSPERTVR